MADLSATAFQKRYDQRELAALNCVNAVQFVLSVFEAQDFEQSREMLQRALDGYRQADDAITEFHSQLKKENSQCHSVQQPKKLAS